ncbi:trypsin-like peptidase domain-containing protein [bacterium]|nr:trypsin-like peptidase domain-containing protein [bacterium]
MKKYIILTFLVAFSMSIFAQVKINYKEIYKQSAPSVVLLFGVAGKTGSTGTGSIVKEDGTILTNAHVVINPATHQPFESLFAFIKPERVNGKNANDLQHRYQAKVLHFDEELDLAVVKMINPPANISVMILADSSEISIGEATAAIGHPEQGSRWSLTTGAVSAEIDDFNGTKGKDVFQMETAVNRGNSGGPLLDYRGYQIGINSMIARESKDGLAIVGINFAIKTNSAVEWMASQGVHVSIAKGDGKEAELFLAQKEETKASTKNEETKVAIKNDTQNSSTKKDDVKLEIKVEEDHATEEISNKQNVELKVEKKVEKKSEKVEVKVVVKENPKRKYKKRPANTKVVSEAKVGQILTETDVLKGRAKKAIKRMDEKLGGFDDDNEPW